MQRFIDKRGDREHSPGQTYHFLYSKMKLADSHDLFPSLFSPHSQREGHGSSSARCHCVSVQRHAEARHPLTHLHAAEQPAVHRYIQPASSHISGQAEAKASIREHVAVISRSKVIYRLMSGSSWHMKEWNLDIYLYIWVLRCLPHSKWIYVWYLSKGFYFSVPGRITLFFTSFFSPHRLDFSQ